MECAMFDNRSDCNLYTFSEAHPAMVTAIDPCSAAALNSYFDPSLINWDMSYMDPLIKMDPTSATSQDSPQFPEPSLTPMLPPIDSGMILSPSYLPPPLLLPSFSSATNLTPPSADYLPIFWDKQPQLNQSMIAFSSEGDSLSPQNIPYMINSQSNIASSPKSVDSSSQHYQLRMASLPPEELIKPSETPVEGKAKSTKHLRRHTISTSTVPAQRKPSVSGGRTRRSSQSLTSEQIEAKKLARLERNRVAACKSRQKRKMLTDDQLTALKILEDDTSIIEEQNIILQAKLTALTDFLNLHRYNTNTNTNQKS